MIPTSFLLRTTTRCRIFAVRIRRIAVATGSSGETVSTLFDDFPDSHGTSSYGGFEQRHCDPFVARLQA